MEFSERRDHWAALAIATVQPFLLTWLMVTLPAIGVYAATASAPALAKSTWSDALHVGSSFWLLGFGATISSGDVRVGIIPLALTLLTLWLVYRAARKAAVVEWGDVAVVGATGALCALAASMAALPGVFRLSAVIGAGLVGAAAALMAWRSWLIPSLAWWDWVERGWRYAWPLLLGLGLAGVLLFIAGLIAGHGRVDALYDAYVTSRGGALGLTLLQLLYLPDFAVWAVSIAAGAPVQVGAGSAFSAFGASAATLPGIPFFGALPAPGLKLHGLLAMPVLAGLGAGMLALRPRHADDGEDADADGAVAVGEGPEHAEPPALAASGRELALEAGAGLLLLFAALTLAGALSSGPLGTRSMLEMGPNPPLFALLATVEAGIGLAIALAARHLRMAAGMRGSDEENRSASVRPEGFEAKPAKREGRRLFGRSRSPRADAGFGEGKDAGEGEAAGADAASARASGREETAGLPAGAGAGPEPGAQSVNAWGDENPGALGESAQARSARPAEAASAPSTAEPELPRGWLKRFEN